jgi:hypothetical protein
MEAVMQRHPDNSCVNDRRVTHRWTRASVGFLGSILAGFILYAAFSQGPAPIDPASNATVAKVSAVKASREEILAKYAELMQRRFAER